jgi:DNA-binding winged helix-turn-helix (wHTH) protein/TolB-like protein/tetratricopeptide (TPR) repeat protein
MTMDLATEPRFKLGRLSIDPATREIAHPGGRETIEPRVMEVLLVLARAKGEVVSRDRLVEECWEGRAVSEDAINRVISRVRKVADLTHGQDFTLETIPKTGYRLIAAGEAPAETAQPTAAPAAPQPAPAKPRRLATLIAAAVALFAIAGIAWAISWRPPPDDAPLTLAVLPFDDLSAANADEQLATGMAREIRNTLSRVRGLRVVSDASSFAVAAENIPAPDIGKRLSADLLLDGSLTRESDPVRGETIKLTAELVDGWSGVNLWTGEEYGPAADLESLRQLMSASVVEQLVARLGPKRIVATSPPRHSNPRVYRLILEARELLQKASALRAYPSRIDELLSYGDEAYTKVERALEITPDDPYALALLGQMTLGSNTHALRTANMTWVERQQTATSFLRRALAADPDNVVALASLGDHYRRNEWRWADGKAMLQRALALDPNQSDIHLAFTYFLTTTGRCVDAARHARAANAIDPEFSWNTLGLPRALKCAGGEEEANDLYLRQLAANPDKPFLLREIYLNHLERRSIVGLRSLPSLVAGAAKGAPLPASVEGVLESARLAANALEGDTAPFLARIEADVESDLKLDLQGLPNDSGRYAPDAMWVHAIEFAAAGAPERAIDCLEFATSHGSLYIPETLPYGAYEFTPEVRSAKRYQAIWRADPRLRDLVKMRLEAVKAGQMHGRLPDGAEVKPEPGKSAGAKTIQP